MYGSIIEAAVRDQQNERIAHAAAVRQAHEVAAARTTSSVLPAPVPLRERTRRAAKHPVLSFNRWLAAGQL